MYKWTDDGRNDFILGVRWFRLLYILGTRIL